MIEAQLQILFQQFSLMLRNLNGFGHLLVSQAPFATSYDLFTVIFASRIHSPQYFAVVEVGNRLSPADVIQHLFNLRPEIQFLDFPGMTIQMPDTAVAQDTVKEALAQLQPVLKENEVRRRLHQRRYRSQ